MTDVPELDIALVGPAYPFRGGIAHFNERMLQGANDRGLAAHIFTFTRQYPAVLFPGKSQMTTSVPRAVPAPTRCIDSLNPVSWLRAARLIKAHRPRVAVFQHWMPFFGPAFGTIARRLRKNGVSSVAVVHNAIPHEPRPGDAALTRYFLTPTQGIVVLSRTVESDVQSLGYSGPIRRVDHPVYDNFGPAIDRTRAREILGLPPDADVILFFGLVRKYKGLQTLLSALPAIIEAVPSVRLVVAGEFYEDQDDYTRQIEKLNLTEHVTLSSGYIPDEAVSTYFSATDAVVQPYLSATQSGVAQIAVNFDRPLVTTDVGGLAETVVNGRTGLVVAPGSSEALAEAVVHFFRDDMRDRMSAAISEDKARFGWQALFDALSDLADDLPQPSPRVGS